MSHDTTAPAPATAPGVLRGWLDAIAVVLAALLAMTVVAALGLWLAGASQLPGSAFPRWSPRPWSWRWAGGSS